MPSIISVMLRSAPQARLEARRAAMQRRARPQRAVTIGPEQAILRMNEVPGGISIVTSGRSGHRLGDPAPAARDRRGDGRGDAAHLLFADPQFEPRFLDRDLRSRRPAHRAGRARADPCRRAALGGARGDRVLPRRHPPGRRLPAERPLSRRQPPARPHRLRAGVRRATSRCFWSINRAHQSDIGGATHGAYNAAATEIWQEGIRITPLQLYDRGEVRRDVLRDDRDQRPPPARFPRRPRGDDRLGACRRAAPAGAGRRIRLGDDASRRSKRCSTAPSARPAR